MAKHYYAKCDMNCFECKKSDCVQTKGLTPEEGEDITRWLPDEAKARKRRNYDKRTLHEDIGK